MIDVTILGSYSLNTPFMWVLYVMLGTSLFYYSIIYFNSFLFYLKRCYDNYINNRIIRNSKMKDYIDTKDYKWLLELKREGKI